jgi:Leucine Rich repeat
MKPFAFSAVLSLCTGFVLADDQPAQEVPPLDEAAAQAIKDAGGNVMAIAQNDPRLDVTLHLSDQDITDEHLAIVARLTPVVWLNLAGTKITDDGLAQIAGMKTLEKLHLEKTGIGDAGLDHLKGLENLVYLNLYGTKVTDAGLEHLTGLKKLRKLYVWQTGVTDEGIAKLKESLPELDVIAGLELKPAEPPAEEPKEGEGAPEEKKDDNN